MLPSPRVAFSYLNGKWTPPSGFQAVANSRDSVSMFTVGGAFFSPKTPACWSPFFRWARAHNALSAHHPLSLPLFPYHCVCSPCALHIMWLSSGPSLCILSSEQGQAAICFPSSLTTFFPGKQTAYNFYSIPESSFQYHTPKIHLLENIRFCLFFKVWSLWLKFCVSCRFLPCMLTP